MIRVSTPVYVIPAEAACKLVAESKTMRLAVDGGPELQLCWVAVETRPVKGTPGDNIAPVLCPAV